MHGLQACLFKYITVDAFRQYAQGGEDAAKRRGLRPYNVDHGKSWNCVLNFCGNPD